MNSRRTNLPVCPSWPAPDACATRQTLACAAGLVLAMGSTFAAETNTSAVNTALLPPPAQRPMDFDRDIRPIFEQSCFRCHGTEKPKSHFSLILRESALKGGDDNTNDIVPGDSLHSHLIQYVAGLDPDIVMPPKGKAEPLTPEQIGRLRAWIDQGAAWSATNQFVPQSPFSVTPTFGWINVRGDNSKFQELEGVQRGWNGGVEQFSLEEQDTPDTKFTLSGHYLAPQQDVQIKAMLTRTDVGFVRAGLESWRQYYDDSGGYYPAIAPPEFNLDRNLYLDVGRAWVDLGLTLRNLPEFVVGYEYQFKDGSKSMLEWGLVQNKRIYPAYKNIDEGTHILKVDVTDDLYGWHLQDRGRVEFYSDSTLDVQSFLFTTGPTPDSTVNSRVQASHVLGANTVSFEKQLKDWWRVSGGYLYSHFSGNSSLNQTTTDSLNVPVAGTFWSDAVTLHRTMNDFSLATLFLPANALTLSLGVQCEFSSQDGGGNINLDAGDPDIPNLFILQPGVVQSDLQETKISENAQLRYTRIPCTVLFAEGQFSQDSISQFEQETGNTPDVFLRDTEYFNHSDNARVGFDTSPWRRLSLNGEFQRRDSDSDYNNVKDESLQGGDGYSAFITGRKATTDAAQTKLVLHPSPKVNTTFTYRWSQSDFTTSTEQATDPITGAQVSPGGQLLAGTYQANTYGLGLSYTPSRRLYLSGTFDYSNSRISTWASDIIPNIIVPYKGNVYTLITSARYSLDDRTTLLASYAFSWAGYGQNNLDGLPLGLDYSRNNLSLTLNRQWTPVWSSSLRYRFYQYDEPSSGGLNNYVAQGVFASVSFKWP